MIDVAVTDYLIAEDLEAASAYNAETWDALAAYPGQRIAGPIETCEHFHPLTGDDCGRPLVVSAYGTWYGSGAVNSFRPIVVTYSCECMEGM